jgi:hypothetical protein
MKPFGHQCIFVPSLLQVIAAAERRRYIWPFRKNVEFKSVPRLSIDEVEVAAQLGGFNF